MQEQTQDLSRKTMLFVAAMCLVVLIAGISVGNHITKLRKKLALAIEANQALQSEVDVLREGEGDGGERTATTDPEPIANQRNTTPVFPPSLLYSVKVLNATASTYVAEAESKRFRYHIEWKGAFWGVSVYGKEGNDLRTAETYDGDDALGIHSILLKNEKEPIAEA